MNAPLHPTTFSSPVGTEQGLVASGAACGESLGDRAGPGLPDRHVPRHRPAARDRPSAASMAAEPSRDRHAERRQLHQQRHRPDGHARQLPDRRPGEPARPLLLPHPGEDRAGCPALRRPADRNRGCPRPGEAQVADLLTQLHNQIQQTYSELATINPGCETLCQVAYASVPGWCAYNQYAIPDWYYNNGCYVGPVFSAGYCGAYAVPVYTTFYNRGSRYNYWNSRAYVHNNVMGISRTMAVRWLPGHDIRIPRPAHRGSDRETP